MLWSTRLNIHYDLLLDTVLEGGGAPNLNGRYSVTN
jgi:hypothetical protein